MDTRTMLSRLIYDGAVSILPEYFSLIPYMSQRFAEMIKVELALRPELSHGYRCITLDADIANYIVGDGDLVLSPSDMGSTTIPVNRDRIRQLEAAGGLIGSADMVAAAIDMMHEPPAVLPPDGMQHIWIIPILDPDDIEKYLLCKLYPILKDKYHAIPYYPMPADILAHLWDADLSRQEPVEDNDMQKFISSGLDLVKPSVDDKIMCEDQLKQIWRIAGMPFSEMCDLSGLTSAKLAAKLHIKVRTVENWRSKGKCPDYVRLMIAEKLGLICL